MSETPAKRTTGLRLALFTGLVVICAAIGTAYVLHARAQNPRSGRPTQSTIAASPLTLAKIMSEPHVLFRNTDLGKDYGSVAVVSLANPRGPRVATPIHECERVAMASGTGVCLAANIIHTAPPYGIGTFNSSFKVLHDSPTVGQPSRARISPDGRWVATTVFVFGDSYAAVTFSTRTTFLDSTTGKVVTDLERFHVTDNGRRVTSINRNYWGVTFAADSDHFYATQGIGTDIRLIEGQVSTRTAHTLAKGVECPALSPDQTRVAYKKRSGGALSAIHWRIHVLDLRTGEDHALAETRNVDDQVEWLDNQTVLYARPRGSATSQISDIWEVPADGTGKPKVFIPRASSPAVDRTP